MTTKRNPPIALIVSLIAVLAAAGAAPDAEPAAPPDPEATDIEALDAVTRRIGALAGRLPSSRGGGREVLLGALEPLLRERLDLLHRILPRDPDLLRRAALPPQAAAAMPAPLLGLVERAASLAGTYAAVVADDFDRGRALVVHHLDVEGLGRLRVHLTGGGAPPAPGAEIRVRGWLLGRDLVAPAASIETFSPPPAAGPEAAARTMNVALILFNFRNYTAQPWTPEFAGSVAFTGTSSARAYYAEASFGLLSLSGAVLGWFTIPYDNTSCGSLYATWAAAARNEAQAAGADVGAFTTFVYVFPSTPGRPGTGWACIGGTEAWIQGSFYNRILIHELGHNVGTNHASTYSCYDAGVRVPLGGSCSRSEYGDPFDVMGGSTNHVNNFHKGRAGWLEAGNTLTVSGDGLYAISPVEPPSAGVQSLRIRRDAASFYYLEYRRPYGVFDAFAAGSPVVNGVSIRLAPDYPTALQSLLLDMTSSTTSFLDAPLPVGSRYDDSTAGISISTVSADPLEAVVDVAFRGAVCARGIPGISISPVSQWGSAGETLPYALTLFNSDNAACAPAIFEATPVLPPGWTQEPAAVTEVLGPGQAVTREVRIASAAGTADGLYSFTETVVNLDDPAFRAAASANFNILPADTMPPVVTIVSPADGSAVSRGSLRILVEAADAGGIARIDVLLDAATVEVCLDSTSCRARVPVAGLAAGPHTITAVAADGAAPAPNTASASVTVLKL